MYKAKVFMKLNYPKRSEARILPCLESIKTSGPDNSDTQAWHEWWAFIVPEGQNYTCADQQKTSWMASAHELLCLSAQVS